MLKTPYLLLIIAVCSVTQAKPALAQYPPANWHSEFASVAIQQADPTILAEDLLAATLRQTKSSGIATLNQWHQRQDYPAPVREAALYSYLKTIQLQGPNSIDPAVLDFIADLPVLTYIEHPDNHQYGVPMFNFRATVAGIRQGWTQADTRQTTNRLLQQSPQRLLSYIKENAAKPQQIAAISQTFSIADIGAIEAAAPFLLDYLQGEPKAAPLLVPLAQRLNQPQLIEPILFDTNSITLRKTLTDVLQQPLNDQTMDLLLQATNDNHLVNSSLILAHIAPLGKTYPEVEQRLFELLQNQQLASTAALALVKLDLPRITNRLQGMLKGDISAHTRNALNNAFQLKQNQALQIQHAGGLQ